jgi:hypothetical protein
VRGLESPSYGPRPRQQKSTDPFLPYLREHLAAYPGLTAVRLWREPRDLGYAGGYTAVKRTVRIGFSRLNLDTHRHTPRPANTSTNTSSAVCSSTQYGVGPQFKGVAVALLLDFPCSSRKFPETYSEIPCSVAQGIWL